MEWEVQGYYKNPDELAPSWHVDCSCDFIEEVEAYGQKNLLDVGDTAEVEIFFGNTGLELFRGIFYMPEAGKGKVAEEQLKSFIEKYVEDEKG
ncbi:MAG: hypothetical protein R8P61_18025 [Bacteroidia bacterium]|nr:hypothetical protein [Bacteroidia bacterium]